MNLIDLKERIAISDAFTTEERLFLLRAINREAEHDGITILDDTPRLGRIDRLWAFLSVHDRGEGICAGPLFGNDVATPLVTSDAVYLDGMAVMARTIVNTFNKSVRLVRFERGDQEAIYRP